MKQRRQKNKSHPQVAFGVTGAPDIGLGDLKLALEGQRDGSGVLLLSLNLEPT